MAGEVTMRSVLGRPQLMAGTQQVAYLLIETMPTTAMVYVQMPVSVVFVLDTSGSMHGEKIAAVQDATCMAVDLLRAEDTIAVVAFNDNHTLLVPQSSAQNAKQIKAKIAKLKADGGTRIGAALGTALAHMGSARSDLIQRIILLTDGQTADDEDECVRHAAQAGQRGMPITALGVGADWNEDLLTAIGERSGGGVDYIDQPAKLLQFFKAGVQSAQAAVIQNAQLTMRMVQGVEVRAVWQVIPLIANLRHQPIDQRSMVTPLGDLEKHQGRTILLELMIGPKPAGTFRIGQLDLQYDVPSTNTRAEHIRQDVLLAFTDNPAAAQSVDARVMNIAEKVSAHKLQTRALDDIAAGNIAGATQKLQSAVTRLLNQGESDLAQSLQQEVHNLQHQGQITAEGKKTIKFGSRKTVRLSDIDGSLPTS